MKKNMQTIAIIALISATTSQAGWRDWFTKGQNYTLSPKDTSAEMPPRTHDVYPNPESTRMEPTKTPLSVMDRIRRYFTPGTNVQTGPSGTKWFDKQGRIVEEVIKTSEGPVTTTYTYLQQPSIWKRLARGARKSRSQQAPEAYPTYAKVLQPRNPNEPTSIKTIGPKGELLQLKELGGKTFIPRENPGIFSVRSNKAFERTQMTE